MAHPSLYLIDDVDAVEREELDRWVRDAGGEASHLVVLPDLRNAPATALEEFADRLAEAGDPLLTPLRVAWLPKERDGRQTARLRDLALGDPRHPARWRKEWVRRAERERLRVVVAEPAPMSELRDRFRTSGGDPDDAIAFGSFVVRQAVLALERAQYRLIGAQYKVPRLVREEIVASPDFRAAPPRRDGSTATGEVWTEIGRVSTRRSPATAGSAMTSWPAGAVVKRSSYGDEVDYDPAQVERVRDELNRHAAVILPSHKSNLDGMIVPIVMQENGLPPVHTFAGINMAFWPLGTVLRRAGRIFIRRDMKDAVVYRWVLRQYLGYLVEKRFTLEWYIEGTRSRSGKLGPPKMGLLRYIVDAVREGRADDVAMVPVSIVYDELHEVAAYAREARGAPKERESLAWMVKNFRAQRRHRGGRIYVRFGEPLSLRAAVHPDATDEDADLELQKLAFEVATRINAVTPITDGKALTARELHRALQPFLAQIRARRLPLAASAESLDTVDGVATVLGSLAQNRTIDAYDRGTEPVYRITSGQSHAAAFYRNTILHHFVPSAIGELALVAASESGDADRLDAFWDEAYRLRDLLKFDFFFEQREAFRKSLATDLNERLPAWENQLVEGVHPDELLEQLQPLLSFGVLRPFIEAHLIGARAGGRADGRQVEDEKAFIASVSRSASSTGDRRRGRARRRSRSRCS
jgi:glycerol-3-phosphate O-acyltransferase